MKFLEDSEVRPGQVENGRMSRSPLADGIDTTLPVRVLLFLMSGVLIYVKCKEGIRDAKYEEGIRGSTVTSVEKAFSNP